MLIESVISLPLSGLAEGAIEEAFQREAARVLANVRDPNTKAEAKREVVIKITFKPKSDRNAVNVDVALTTKLAPAKPVETVVFIESDKGRLVGREPEQLHLAVDPNAN